MRVAIVHDYLNQMGGAEKVVETFHSMFPEAPVFTSVYDPDAVSPVFRQMDVRTSFMQKLPMIKQHARRYLAFYPYAFELFDLSGYDVVLSSSSAFAKGVITKPDTCHICYCHTPMRFGWNYHAYIEREPMGCLAKTFLPYVIHRVRRWDEITSSRVDYFVANSTEVYKRIKKHYRRESTVIYPPADTNQFTMSRTDEGYYFIMSRLLPYKKIDIVIEAFNRMRLPLEIAGDGRDIQRLRSMAGPTVKLLGRLPFDQLVQKLKKCRALIFPGHEDFGLTPVEAMACGKPVIAYAAGGALDTVQDGVTGMFFYEQTPEAVAEAVREFRPGYYNPETIRARALTFDVDVFKQRMLNFIRDKYREHQEEYNLIPNARVEAVAPIRYPVYAEQRASRGSLEDE
jgi:glycosyltransferase involved in cell wall biosynthesis